VKVTHQRAADVPLKLDALGLNRPPRRHRVYPVGIAKHVCTARIGANGCIAGGFVLHADDGAGNDAPDASTRPWSAARVCAPAGSRHSVITEAITEASVVATATAR
jgi:hypothetical protein